MSLQLTPSRKNSNFIVLGGVAAGLALLTPVHAFLSPLSIKYFKAATGGHVSNLCKSLLMAESTQLGDGYDSPEKMLPQVRKKKVDLLPKVGDIVRYYDTDGGKEDGQVLVGKIAFIQQRIGKKEWLVDLNELDDVGDGYYAEYSSRERSWKKTTRPLDKVSPVAASFVRSENAFKIPRESDTMKPAVRQESYDLENYDGPSRGVLNEDLLASDLVKYSDLKGSLLRNAAVAGVLGTLVAQIARGTEDAVVYGLGATAGVFYLYFLTVKTDTMGYTDTKLGKSISNIRFLAPVIVLVAVALYNKSLGDANPMASSTNIFSLVTPEQYAAAVLGFLTYRIPLFGGQIAEFLKDGDNELNLPGSAGIAMKLVKADVQEKLGNKNVDGTLGLTPVIVVSGPQSTGRSELVQKLISESAGRYVAPTLVDRNDDGATFERMQQRGDFLYIDDSERYGLTRDSILKAGTNGQSVVIVDADVALAKGLATIPKTRLIGVWVGLDSVAKFQSRLQEQVDCGIISIPEDETRESVVRAKIREIVRDIEYGIVSGVFEFTILNDDPEDSLKQLRTAAEYSFK